MLKSLDILIGLSVIMLIVSIAVTLINQALLSALTKRGRCLQQGLADLLQHLDWKMPRQIAEDVAAIVLTQPSVRKRQLGPVLGAVFPSLQFGEIIHREEFTKILLGFGPLKEQIETELAKLGTNIQGNIIEEAQTDSHETKDDKEAEVQAALLALTAVVEGFSGVRHEIVHEIIKGLKEIGETKNLKKRKFFFDRVQHQFTDLLDPITKVVTALAANDIDAPGDILKKVRLLALELEKINPEQPSDQRHSAALLHLAPTQFLGKINFAFDQTMDRVTERYTLNARVITFISAAIVAVGLQLDTVYLVNRLSMDDQMRAALVSEAAKMVVDSEEGKKGAPTREALVSEAAKVAVASEEGMKGVLGSLAVQKTTAEAPQSPAAKPSQPDSDAKRRVYLSFLAKEGVIRLPDSGWWKAWHDVNPSGVCLSILLLSMGAPFWYNVIGKLVQFRSLLAQKDDNQRQTRQSAQKPESV